MKQKTQSRDTKALERIAAEGIILSKNLSQILFALGAACTLAPIMPKQAVAKLFLVAENGRKLCEDIISMANHIIDFDEKRIITDVKKDIQIVSNLPTNTR